MKKKLISLLTAFSMTLMLLTGVPISVSAEVVASGNCGKYTDEDITWSLDSSGVLTISGEGEMKKFTFDDNAPWKGSNVKRVIIESGVTTIGEEAFHGCSELVSVEIPNTVTHIKRCAFMECHKLKLDRLPESVWYIESQAFQGCYSLETLDLPGVYTIEYAAFEGCSTGQVSDMDITLCTGLRAVNMPEAVYISDSAFSRCFNLETVNAPKVKVLNAVFQHCRMLTSVYIPSVKTIKRYAFNDCYRLLSFEIPPNVKVESKAFYGMSSSVIYYHESCTVQPDSFPNVRAEVKYTVTDGETELEIVKAGNYSHVNFPETIGGGKVVSANWEEFLTDDYPKRELTHDGEHNADENMICRICGNDSGEHK
ncbi:MAG: leucine-rich repeat domain-containing protein, partial [Oscillospiraceae bacterium]|nr:leucine-rich repeat domain-containing protein [Oscillospiraceae bacterium]